ncbi:hypothetical protein F4779DRAFT_559715 [Xylariaceae sp. FL0662B]|nr:hypothetical protein F4779DRAFT_559715 [Xylariaceae sp. FL0662B]
MSFLGFSTADHPVGPFSLLFPLFSLIFCNSQLYATYVTIFPGTYGVAESAGESQTVRTTPAKAANRRGSG